MTKTCKQSFLKLLLCLLIAGISAGCGDNDDNTNPQNLTPDDTTAIPSAGLRNFSSDAELETYLKEQYAAGVIEQNVYRNDEVFVPMAEDTDAGTNTESGGGYTKTNVQEEGVDESDTVKIDGTHMYITGDRKVTIVKAIPENAMQSLSTIEVDGYVDSLYLYNNTLVILYTPDGGEGTSWGGGISFEESILPYWIPVQSYTGVLFFNVTDPSNPSEITRVKAEGILVSSRLTGGKLHVIQQFLPNLPPLRVWHDGTEEDKNTAISENQTALEPVVLDDLIPSCTIITADGSSENRHLVEPADFYCPVDPEGGSNVTVMTFDMAAPTQPFQSIGVVASADVVYASTNALYIAAIQWPHYDFGILETDDGTGKEPDEESDNTEKTSIHKFDLTGDKVRAAGSGSVKGRILNQFSLGEYNDVLRIATTTGQSWWWGASPDSKNHVFCMKETENGLNVIGSIEDLAPGEQIYSARFIGSKGYLVTFVQVDPLFTLDLSDPVNPVVVGELKIPGYSDYIHPMGDNYLLTIGKDAKSDGNGTWYQGVQLSIFDISDFSNPRRIQNEIIGDRGTHSEAAYNHKAFTFWMEKDLLAVPIDLHKHQKPPAYPSDYADYVSSGLYIYRVTPENGFDYIGNISTSVDDNPYYYYRLWTRGIFIDESVYAVTPELIRTAPVSDLTNINTLVLDTTAADKYPDYVDAPAEEPDEDAAGRDLCQYDQDCNDDPSVSSLWGSCNPDGSCLCNDGMEINPETDKCRPVD